MNAVNVYALVAPVILVLVLAEFLYCLKKRNGYYSFQDSLIGLGTAIIAQCVNVAVAVAVIGVYGWLYDRFAIQHLEPTTLNYILCYLGVDFLFYWFHRAGHRINILWAAHVPHHSAEELNYAVALRSSFTQRAASFLFYWPLAVLGFSPEIILPMVALNLVLQFIPHTRVIGKLPQWIQLWLNTPYHHQVHHAANEIYWDRNYGGTFIIWDRMFGTYRDQTEEPYYGVTIHPKSWDATYLNLHWFIVIWKDMMAADHFIDKIKVCFMPPGWRPRNLPPFEKSQWKNADTQIKYQTKAMPGSTAYLVAQLAISMAAMFLVIRKDTFLTTGEQLWLSFVLWLNVTTWGAILERRSWIRTAEYVRIALFYGSLMVLVPTWMTGFATGIATVGVANLCVWTAIASRSRATVSV
ncbi:MAG: sterol desaturase family protein [Bdellovibrionales bacterium]|nr:sterol desaturase family protein [Bdellovibrionales bacterium]